MSKINYVLAKDEDFIPNNFGSFTYIGKEAYVEIPCIIHGQRIDGCQRMFKNNGSIRGVKSTNPDIKSLLYAFSGCKAPELNLAEFDFSNITDMGGIFHSAEINKIMFPPDRIINPVSAAFMALELKTDVLDLSTFSFFRAVRVESLIDKLDANSVIFPEHGIDNLVKLGYSPLRWIPAEKQTEDICWMAISKNKELGKFAKIKSKKILMYLGTDCPEYVSFYYNN